MKSLFLSLCLALPSAMIRAAHNVTCATRSPNRCEKVVMRRGQETWKTRYLESGRRLGDESKHRIKVYFWALRRKKDGRGKLKMKYVDTFMSYLQEAFKDTHFEFKVKARKYKYDDMWHRCSGLTSIQQQRKGDETTLNVYVCDCLANIGVMGYATFPHEVHENFQRDGIVIMNPSLDNVDHVKEIFATFIHEVGHWLGLLHTFESACDPDVEDDGGVGDGVQDTPAHSGPSWYQTGWKTCHNGLHLDTCADSIDGIDSGYDPVRNFMNYIHEDCMIHGAGEFTEGQRERMLSQFEEHRLTAKRRRLEPALQGVTDIWQNETHITFPNSSTIIRRRRRLQPKNSGKNGPNSGNNNSTDGGGGGGGRREERKGMQSTNDTHLMLVCMLDTLDECGCDMECVKRTSQVMGRVEFEA